jgi:hypothetical protein
VSLDGLAERGGDLAEHVEHHAGVERGFALEHLAQVLAADIFLGDEVDAVGLADFVDLHDVRVDERGGGARLVEEPLDVRAVAGERSLQHLERDLPAERPLLGQVHLGHTAGAQASQNAIVAQFAAGQINGVRWHGSTAKRPKD